MCVCVCVCRESKAGGECSSVCVCLCCTETTKKKKHVVQSQKLNTVSYHNADTQSSKDAPPPGGSHSCDQGALNQDEMLSKCSFYEDL